MAYYKKQELIDYISSNVKRIEKKGLRPLKPVSDTIKKIDDEEDLVAFFWIEYEDNEKSGEKLKMEGKCWYRIDADLYTDDRFALDLYQAMMEELNVSDIIRKREREKELASQGIVDMNSVEDKVKENITKKDGA